MKPRLEPLSLTAEDEKAWAWGYLRFPRMPDFTAVFMLFSASRDADRRDADLMLRLGRTKHLSPPHPTGRAVVHSLMRAVSDGFNVAV
jgi:hypothetical protein